jgi:hypothetical protein
MGTRPMIKLKHRPIKTWLPQALETLKLEAVDLKQSSVVGASCLILKRVKALKTKQLRQLYHQVKCSSRGSRNKTFMTKHVCYSISLGLNHASKGMRRNYAEFLLRKPEEQLDIYGYCKNSSSLSKPKKEVKPRKKTKQSSKPSQRSRRAGRPTITSLIVEAIQRDGGSTKEEVIAHVLKKYPERSEAVPKTVQVQLSYHMPKRFGNSFRRKGEKFILST